MCDSKLKDLLPMLPVIYFKAVVVRDTWEPTKIFLNFFIEIVSQSRQIYMRHNPTIYDTPLYMTLLDFVGVQHTLFCARALKSVVIFFTNISFSKTAYKRARVKLCEQCIHGVAMILQEDE